MRLPGAFRRLPRPSSALKPSHSPDSVACPGLGGVYWRLMKPYVVLLRRLAYAWCHVSVILATGFALSTLHPDRVRSGAASNLMGNIKMLLELLEASSNNIRFVSCGLGVLNDNFNVVRGFFGTGLAACFVSRS